MKFVESKTSLLVPFFNLLPILCIVLMRYYDNLDFNVLAGVIALSVIYTGTHCSLTLVAEDENSDKETLSMQDALLFPLQIGAVLQALQWLIKNFQPDMVNFALRIQFCFAGLLSGTQAISLWVNAFLPDALRNSVTDTIASFKGYKITQLNLLCLIPAASITGAWYVSNDLLLGNLLAQFLSVLITTQISFDRFDIAFVLLWLLFFYDIAMVFYSDLMITVAKGVDLPIGLKAFRDGRTKMLGLGDIVFPGLFVAMCQRFDCVRNVGRRDFVSGQALATMAGQLAGLLVCFYIMKVYNHPQPALLQLVPGVTLSFLLAVLVKGEVKEMVAYRENDETEGIKNE